MPVSEISTRPVSTTLQITLVEDAEGGSPKLVIRGPMYNPRLCAKILQLALQGIGDRERQQVDCGRGGGRLLLPASANLLDLYHAGKKKV